MFGRIVVGVDGSEGSVAALRWAVAEGRRRESVVEALLVWLGMSAAGLGDIPYLPDEEGRIVAAEHDRLSDAIARALEEPGGADGPSADGPSADGASEVTVQRFVVEGDAASVLCERSQHADLLVVGFPRHGGVSHLLYGSVSSHCMRHGRCPVVAIPHPDRRAGDDRTGGG